ncbi:hypothetical protein [Streptomyces sp. NPDC086989]|uniref:hypothetical protein n=1 Tax=Streptomyces sp. NPDC086989 TaxID=3365764 RepID=UPI00382A5197
MWFFHSLTDLFHNPTQEAHLQLFRIALGFACVVKFLGELVQGMWNFLAVGTYSRHELGQRRGPDAVALIAALHHPVTVLRLTAALALTLGPWPHAAAAAVTLGLAFELTYLYRFNTVYLMLCAACLMFAGAPGRGLSVTYAQSSANTFAQFLIVLITSQMYVNSAWIKARSPHFRSGLRVAQWIEAGAAVRPLLPRREYFYPAPLVRLLGSGSPRALRIGRPLAVLVIAIEALLPLGLLVPETRPWAVVVGICMHLCFWGLLPLMLAGFSLATTASYLLFAG